MVHLLYGLSSLAQYVEQYYVQQYAKQKYAKQSNVQRSIAPGQLAQNIRFSLPLGNWMKRSVQRFNRSY